MIKTKKGWQDSGKVDWALKKVDWALEEGIDKTSQKYLPMSKKIRIFAPENENMPFLFNF